MNIVNVKLVINTPRFYFPLYIELSKYLNVFWLLGCLNNETNINKYKTNTHNIYIIGKNNKIRKKLYGLIDEIRFIKKVISILKSKDSDIIIIHFHRLAFLYPLFCLIQNWYLDLYTTSVNKSRIKRIIWDMWERFVCKFYRIYFIPTENDKDAFHLNKRKISYVIPSPLEPISKTKKEFKKIKLFYIGTLHNRNVEDTVKGLALFLKSNINNDIVSYDIIGRGHKEDEEKLISTIINNNLEDIVHYHGFLNDEEVIPFFDNCNIGVAYVPVTKYYTNVLVTKLFEYLQSGLAAIATKTNENKKIITDINGVIIEDSPEGFAKGLGKITMNLDKYSSEAIANTVKEYTVEYYVKNHFLYILEDIAKIN
jgi:glycosyltransferase involved in cell wall biosynthesis